MEKIPVIHYDMSSCQNRIGGRIIAFIKIEATLLLFIGSKNPRKAT